MQHFQVEIDSVGLKSFTVESTSKEHLEAISVTADKIHENDLIFSWFSFQILAVFSKQDYANLRLISYNLKQTQLYNFSEEAFN